MISSSRSMLYRFSYPLRLALCGVRRPVALPANSARQSPLASGDDRAGVAAGMAMRLMAAQAVARLADRLDAPKVILALCTTAATLIGLG